MGNNGSRTRKAVKNSSISLLGQLVSLVCSFILPRLILTTFGSDYNGITSSISQFIECVILLRAGVGGVTRAALYKPLAENDSIKINGIVNATKKFMQRVSIIFAVGLVIFACIYPFAVSKQFDWFFAFSLVLILGISTFAQNYFGITYQILIEADQNNYIYTLISIVTTICNTFISVLLINSGFSIHVVKLGSAIVFSLNPILLSIYANKNYKLNSKIEPNNEAISQRWDAFAQQVATFVTNNTDIVVLTIFTDLKEVSVYTVYYMIANRLRTLVQTLTNGIDAAFGNIMARKEEESLQANFKIYEHLVFSVSTFSFACAAILIEPFIMVYTSGVNDVNYSRVAFGILMCINQFLYCVRLPYQMLSDAAGHFKQTRNGAIFEAILNISISIILVIKWGLIGVTIGTFCALSFRTFQYAIYSSKNILHRKSTGVIIHLFVSGLEGFVAYAFVNILLKHVFKTVVDNYLKWGLMALFTAIILTVIIVLISLVLYSKETKALVSKLISIKNK